MITLQITETHLKLAKVLYNFCNLNNSITNGESNIYGALGEIIVHDYFKDKYVCEFNSTFDYDMIINNKKVDVKTRKAKGIPRGKCGFPAFNPNQKCDYYFFANVSYDFKTGYIMGYVSKDDFFKLAVLKKKGDLDDDGKFIFKSDSYVIYYNQLTQFKN